MSETNTKIKTRLVFLSEKKQVDSMWSKLVPYFQRAIDEAVKGEFTLNSMKELVDEKRCFIAYIEDDHEILMALAMEFKPYPDLKTLNVMAMAGKRMSELFQYHHEQIASFARAFGVTEFECSGSKGMAKMLIDIGWYDAYTVTRFKI